MVFYKDESVLGSHPVKPLEVVSMSPSKKSIWFSPFSYSLMSPSLGQPTYTNEIWNEPTVFTATEPKSFLLSFVWPIGKYQNGDWFWPRDIPQRWLSLINLCYKRLIFKFQQVSELIPPGLSNLFPPQLQIKFPFVTISLESVSNEIEDEGALPVHSLHYRKLNFLS